ncbi:ThiF family adenylyltransferase [Streptomyces sp. YIM 98790]|uniref:ThiF family adenylyltransferase n=1 Tax=Streptomyces sp. YIM 98790 TaxID=2689077 RepID=UPI001409032F|nr:ThiF family adenylyltransferase [Streptomyces sp. YIM 98790]
MTKRKSPARATSPWQQDLLSGLKALAAQHPEDLRVLGGPQIQPDGSAWIRIRLHTADIPHTEGGLVLGEDEDFILDIPPIERVPPQVLTPHTRFAGTPHVLEGVRLCLYLDTAREWNPEGGVPAVLNRLWQWLTDAASNRFDATTALYHAVGGVLHRTDGTPTIVVREPNEHRTAHTGWLTPRFSQRLDLSRHQAHEQSMRLPVLPLGHHLPLGAGHTLADLLNRIDNPTLGQTGALRRPGLTSPAFLTALTHSARRNPEGTNQYFILAVPHPGLPAGPRFLLAGRLSVPVSDTLRRTPRPAENLSALPADVGDSAVEWCYLSEEREAVTTRRDAQRPVNAFHGTHVHLWGCGGIGSWAAELIARAGAARISLSDPGTPITGGLLVRQNYTEADVGENKAVALAKRLRSLRDDLIVDISPPPPSLELLDAAQQADVIIDATISITAGRFLDLLARHSGRTAVLAQMATDPMTASHGILTVSAPGTGHGPALIDQTTGQHVLARPALESYHQLWSEPQPGQEIRPTRGCSVPTFHGSAADLASITATLVTLLGMQMHHPVSGTHLCAQPHTGTQPSHYFIPYPPHPDDPPAALATIPTPAPLLPPTSRVGT